MTFNAPLFSHVGFHYNANLKLAIISECDFYQILLLLLVFFGIHHKYGKFRDLRAIVKQCLSQIWFYMHMACNMSHPWKKRTSSDYQCVASGYRRNVQKQYLNPWTFNEIGFSSVFISWRINTFTRIKWTALVSFISKNNSK